MLCIGITGSIGTGKSTVSAYLKEKGFKVIDADIISRQISEKDQPGYYAVLRLFGESILDSDAEIDRKKLSEIVFKDKQKLEILNNALHPVIIDRINELKKCYQEREELIFVDAALLIETGLYKYMDKVILVHSCPEIQISRVMNRDKTSLEKVERIIKSQMPYNQKKTFADYIIDNNHDISYLHGQIDMALDFLLKDSENDKKKI